MALHSSRAQEDSPFSLSPGIPRASSLAPAEGETGEAF